LPRSSRACGREAGVTDFTSALYLGFEHSSRSLPAWPRLTTGRPAALVEPESAEEVQTALAALTGCERAQLVPSTLHAFFDVLPALAKTGAAFLLDEDAYPIAERVLRCVAGTVFGTRCGNPLEAALQRCGGRKPVIVTDGFFPLQGRAAPLRRFAELAGDRGGMLVVDDTQALGVLGSSPSGVAPYGSGGGGSLRFCGIERRNVILVASLAKAFGAPVAMIAGSEGAMEYLERGSFTRVHCSPVSAAAVAASKRALAINCSRAGDALRMRLARLVARFGGGGVFPVQRVACPKGIDAVAMEQALLARGIRGVVARAPHMREAQLCLLVTARHTERDIDHALESIAEAYRPHRLKLCHRPVLS
jgi:8-amino-7-oxononanoate synthase